MHGVEGGGGFAASVSAFNAALITCVARMVLSLELSCASREAVEAGFLDAVLALDDFVAEVDLMVLDTDFVADVDDSVSRRSNSFRDTTVAGVHVVVDDTAALTASVDACNEAM